VKKESAGDIFEPEKPIVPADWDVIPFEEAAQVVSDRGKRVKQGSYLPSGRLPVIDQGQDYVGGYTDDETMAFEGELPVVLFGDHTRAIKYADRRFAVGAEGVKILRPKDCYEPKFFYYLLRSLQIPSRGYSRHFQFLRKFYFPVAPKPQQHRIVAEIEKQFSRLDEAVANLKRVKANLKRYKAAVLKAAVEGKLTEEWRKVHSDVEPASELLKRILAERRAKWEQAELAKMRMAGKDPKDNKWKNRYKEADPVNTGYTYEIPESWVWTNLGQLSWSVKDVPHYSPKYSASGIPFITGGNIRPEGIDFSSAKYISPQLHAELSERCKPEYGDLLYTKGGTTGIARINTEKREFSVWVHVAVLKLVDSIERFYLQHALNSSHCYRQSQIYTHGVGNQDLGLTRMIWITIPLPPLDEQKEIIREIEKRVSILGELDREVDTNLKRAERLRQSLLEKAFSGKLIPENPNDEPASALLERIRQEEAKTGEEPKKGRGKTMAKQKGNVSLERRSVLSVLASATGEVSTAKLIDLAGYPSNADPESIEAFYLDLRAALTVGNIQVRRRGDVDYFSVRK
jgi:type I restriction enzyme S subunit